MKKSAWTSEEQKAKIYRIEELAKEGFNTPRFFYLPPDSSDKKFDQVTKWIYKIHKDTPDQVFNIRTYKRNRKTESVQSPHKTDVSFVNIINESLILTFKSYHCMIDAETPDNGRLAGNVVIKENGEFAVDFCYKLLRAMVRDHDKSIKGKLTELPQREFGNIFVTSILKQVIKKANSFSKKNVILEWCWMSEPAGTKQENLIWWEYRKFEEV